MTRHPLLNALCAELYIAAIVLVMHVVTKVLMPVDQMLIPIAMLSLFVLSAAVMGYLFCYGPLRLYLDGEKETSVRLFLTTVGYFALITTVMFCALMFTAWESLS